MSQEIDETIKRLHAHKGIVGTIVANSEGVLIKSSLNDSAAGQYAVLVRQLSDKARNCVRDLDPGNDLEFLRIVCKKREVMVAPDKDFTLIVIQDTNE